MNGCILQSCSGKYFKSVSRPEYIDIYLDELKIIPFKFTWIKIKIGNEKCDTG